MEVSEILSHFPRKIHILEVIVKCVGSSFSVFSGKKNVFPNLVDLL